MEKKYFNTQSESHRVIKEIFDWGMKEIYFTNEEVQTNNKSLKKFSGRIWFSWTHEINFGERFIHNSLFEDNLAEKALKFGLNLLLIEKLKPASRITHQHLSQMIRNLKTTEAVLFESFGAIFRKNESIQKTYNNNVTSFYDDMAKKINTERKFINSLLIDINFMSLDLIFGLILLIKNFEHFGLKWAVYAKEIREIAKKVRDEIESEIESEEGDK